MIKNMIPTWLYVLNLTLDINPNLSVSRNFSDKVPMLAMCRIRLIVDY